MKARAIVVLVMLVLLVMPWLNARPDYSDSDTGISRRLAALVAASEHAMLVSFDPETKGWKSAIVNDRAWIKRFAAVLGEATFQQQGHLFAVSDPIVFSDREGNEVLKIEVFESSLRVNGSDYRIGARSCVALKALRREKSS